MNSHVAGNAGIRVLVVKHGALGDVVRTSYFAGALKKKHGSALHLTWITAKSARPLLAHNPSIDRLCTSFDELAGERFDIVYSLDDEREVVSRVAELPAARQVGAILQGPDLTYTPDSGPWFDMGLLSKYGKTRADELKRRNTLSHAEIFQQIFEVAAVSPTFYPEPAATAVAADWFPSGPTYLGINPYAGGRWPSKELRTAELRELVDCVLSGAAGVRADKVVLFGAAEDRVRNLAMASEIRHPSIIVADTDQSIMVLASCIARMSAMISSDSLALHLALAQSIPTIAFFAPTSAVEIDAFGLCDKVVSTSPDYCNYAKNCDNSSITARRIIASLQTSSLFRHLQSGTRARA